MPSYDNNKNDTYIQNLWMWPHVEVKGFADVIKVIKVRIGLD